MGFPVQRLNVIKSKIEDVAISVFHEPGKKVLVVWPHSHAPMLGCKFDPAPDERWDIAMPCCYPLPAAFARTPHISYEDPWVLSPKRTVHIWKPEHGVRFVTAKN